MTYFANLNKMVSKISTINFITLILLQFPTTTFGQSEASIKDNNSNNLALDNKLIESKLGSGWTGILFICDPYCRLLSVREKNNWNPPLPTIKVDVTSIKSIAKSDPLYPYFIKELSKDSDNAADDKLKKEKILVKDDTVIPPDYANSKFNFGYNISVGVKTLNQKLTTDSEIQSSAAVAMSGFSPSYNVGIMKGNPLFFFNQYWQLKLEYQTGSNTTFEIKSTNEKVSVSSTNIKLGSFLMRKNYKPYFGISSNTQKFQAPTESLVLFSTSSNRNFLDLGLNYSRFYIELSYPISTQINDKQGFRTSPLTDSTIAAKLQYSSKDHSAFDFNFGYSIEAGYQTSKQSSGVSSQIVSIEKSNIQQTQTYLMAMLRFGEDFFQ